MHTLYSLSQLTKSMSHQHKHQQPQPQQQQLQSQAQALPTTATDAGAGGGVGAGAAASTSTHTLPFQSVEDFNMDSVRGAEDSSGGSDSSSSEGVLTLKLKRMKQSSTRQQHILCHCTDNQSSLLESCSRNS
jgi:hypothetical protein